MNDAQIGFLLMVLSIFLAGAITGFKKVRGDIEIELRAMVAYVLLALLWYMGTLALYPTFVEGQGSNTFIAFSTLMVVMTAIAVLASSFLWYHIFGLFHWAAKQYCAAMVPRTGRR